MDTELQKAIDACKNLLSYLDSQPVSHKQSPFDKFWYDTSHKLPPTPTHKATWNGALETAIDKLLLNSNDAERLRAMKV